MIRRPFLWLTLALTPVVAWPAQAADPKYLPGDTEVIFTVNFRQILDSPLVKKQKDALDQAKGLLENALQGQEEAQRYLKAAGFELFRDLTSVTIGVPPGNNPENGFIIIEGDFNSDKLNATAENAARDHPGILKVTTEGKQKIFEVSAPNGKELFISLAQKKNLLVSSSREGLLQAIARGEGSSGKGGLKANVKRLAEATNARQSFSFVMTGSAINKSMEGKNLPNAEILGPLLQSLEGISGAVTIDKDVQLQIGIGASDADSAQKMAQAAQVPLLFLRGMITTKAKEDEKFAPLLDVAKTMRITTQGSNLVFRADLSAEVIETLMKTFRPN